MSGQRLYDFDEFIDEICYYPSTEFRQFLRREGGELVKGKRAWKLWLEDMEKAFDRQGDLSGWSFLCGWRP